MKEKVKMEKPPLSKAAEQLLGECRRVLPGIEALLGSRRWRHPSEIDERIMVRLFAFALYADDALTFGKGMNSDDEPDLWHVENRTKNFIRGAV